jgi:Tol biopolymer transport system component
VVAEQRLQGASSGYFRSKIAVEVGANGDNDIWIVDATLGTPVRFTSNGSSYSPVWSPDGRRIAYSEIDFASPSGTLVLARDISDPTRIDTLDGGEIAFPNSWSSDGRFLAYISGAREASDIFVLDLENRQSAPFQDTDADTELAAFSPDGRWLAFTSDESGPPRVYVRLFPDGGNRVLVSEDLGWAPEWSTDGRQIYYGASSNYLRVSDFDPDTGVVQPSRQLPGPDGMLLFFGFSVHPDGRLLVVRSSSGGGDEAGTPENAVLDFVINFDAELRARTPGDS